jgi:hypothetical protein
MNFSYGGSDEKLRVLEERVRVLGFCGQHLATPSPTEWDFVNWIVGANSMMKHLGRSKGVLFRVRRIEGGVGVEIKPAGKGDEFLRLAFDVAPLRPFLSPMHDMHPHASLFRRAVEQRDLRGTWERANLTRSPDWLERYVQVLNDCVAELRWELGSIRLKRSLEHRLAAQARYAQGLRRYFDDLVAHDACQRVERLEFRLGSSAEDGFDGELMSRWYAFVRQLKMVMGDLACRLCVEA